MAREKSTERAFTDEYWDHKGEGVYRYVACGTPLYSSETKFDSGTGWPRFTDPAVAANLEFREDRGVFMRRTEVVCTSCDGHLGHVFDDGPGPRGDRFCINSAALKLDPSPKA